jgi:hypothetical protein
MVQSTIFCLSAPAVDVLLAVGGHRRHVSVAWANIGPIEERSAAFLSIKCGLHRVRVCLKQLAKTNRWSRRSCDVFSMQSLRHCLLVELISVCGVVPLLSLSVVAELDSEVCTLSVKKSSIESRKCPNPHKTMVFYPVHLL